MSRLRRPSLRRADLETVRARMRAGSHASGAETSFPRLGGLCAERLEVLAEGQSGSRPAASALLEAYHFRIIGRDQKLSVAVPASSQLAEVSGLDARGKAAAFGTRGAGCLRVVSFQIAALPAGPRR